MRRTPDTHTFTRPVHFHAANERSALLLPTRFVLKGFAKGGRDLTDKETKAFLKAADKDGDGKIGVEGKSRQRPMTPVTPGSRLAAS